MIHVFEIPSGVCEPILKSQPMWGFSPSQAWSTMEPNKQKKQSTKKLVQKSASSAARGVRRIANHSYEKQWARDRKQAYAGKPITYKVGNMQPTKFSCHCTVCPCKHM